MTVTEAVDKSPERHIEIEGNIIENILDDLDEDIDSPFFKIPLAPPPKPKVSDRDP